MATTTSLPGLQAFLAELGLELEPIPSFAAADVLNKPIDIYHSYLAEHFQKLVDCDRGLVYDSIQPANATENGDLDVVLPKLKLPGITPKELAGELLKKVWRLSQFPQWFLEESDACVFCSFNPILSSPFPSRMGYIFDSFSLPKPYHESFSRTSTTAKLYMALIHR